MATLGDLQNWATQNNKAWSSDTYAEAYTALSKPTPAAPAAPTPAPTAPSPTPAPAATPAATTTVTGDKVTYDPTSGRILTSSNPNTPIYDAAKDIAKVAATTPTTPDVTAATVPEKPVTTTDPFANFSTERKKQISDIESLIASGPNEAANDILVNDLFKAYHNRTANAQEIAKFSGMSSAKAMESIKGGAISFMQQQGMGLKSNYTGITQGQASQLDAALAKVTNGQGTAIDIANLAYAIKSGKYTPNVPLPTDLQTKVNTYITSTEYSNLKNKYTAYQIEQSTMRDSNGDIYFTKDINTIPRQPVEKIDESILNDISSAVEGGISEGKKEDETYSKTTTENKVNETKYESPSTIYSKFYDTPEMSSAKSDLQVKKDKLTAFDAQIEDLKSDIKKEVKGEASESYISALASVRGEDILKQKRQAQIDYDNSLNTYNSIISKAENGYKLYLEDQNFRMKEVQAAADAQEAKFGRIMDLADLALKIPQGQSLTIGGEKLTGLKENDSIKTVDFTDATGNKYVFAYDKNTGKQLYKTYIGKEKTGTGTGTETMTVDQAKLWLQLSKDKDGVISIESIPSAKRDAIVKTITANPTAFKDTSEKTFFEKVGTWVSNIGK